MLMSKPTEGRRGSVNLVVVVIEAYRRVCAGYVASAGACGLFEGGSALRNHPKAALVIDGKTCLGCRRARRQ
jgi:hypothetical protein